MAGFEKMVLREIKGKVGGNSRESPEWEAIHSFSAFQKHHNS